MVFMSKRITTHEFDGACQVRDDAREIVGDLFPKARVEVQMTKIDGTAGVEARIVGDTTPHATEDIIDCLGELGVGHISVIEPGALQA